MKFLVIMLIGFSINGHAQQWSGPVYRSGGGGNGGDYVRMKFLEVGNFILRNYKQSLIKVTGLSSLERMRRNLNINVISLSRDPLYDNHGSLVDALGELNRIVLYQGDGTTRTGWLGIYERDDLVEKLVLHEMLRATGIDDDNYIYSTKILSSFDRSYLNEKTFVRWCSETAKFIDSSLNRGIRFKTYDDEINEYVQTLRKIEKVISPKHYYFIKPSVVGALEVIKLIKQVKHKVMFLRITLKQIAKDIRFIDKRLKARNGANLVSIGDNSSYARSYIISAKKFTILTSDPVVESKIFDIVFDQLNSYMINSDNARSKYLGVLLELDSARYTPVLDYKRRALNYIKTLLD